MNSSHRPSAGHIRAGVCKRADKRNRAFFLQWQDLFVVLQKHHRLGSHLTGKRTVLSRENLARTALRIAVAVGVVKQTEFVFRLKDSAASLIHFSLRYLALLHCLFEVGQTFRYHIHIKSGLERENSRRHQVAGSAVAHELLNSVVV